MEAASPPPSPDRVGEATPLLPARGAIRPAAGGLAIRRLLAVPVGAVVGGIAGGTVVGFGLGSALGVVVVHAWLGAGAYDFELSWTPVATAAFSAVVRGSVKGAVVVGAGLGAAYPLLPPHVQLDVTLAAVKNIVCALGALAGAAVGAAVGSAASNAALWEAEAHHDGAVTWARELGAAAGAALGGLAAGRWLHAEISGADLEATRTRKRRRVR